MMLSASGRWIDTVLIDGYLSIVPTGIITLGLVLGELCAPTAFGFLTNNSLVAMAAALCLFSGFSACHFTRSVNISMSL